MQVWSDLSLNLHIDVKFLLSSRDYDVRYPDQNYLEILAFRSAPIEALTENDNVLILSHKRSSKTLAAICAKTKKTYHISDIWPDMWWRAMIGEGLREIQELFPFLPIILFRWPLYPTNKSAYSEIEKHMDKKPLVVSALRQPNPAIPRTYEDFGYTATEILEMLDATRSYVDGKKIKSADFNGQKVNIINGHRIVPGVPLAGKRTIYLFGGCSVFGIGCPDGGTSSAHLQKLLTENFGDEFRVENFGMFLVGRIKYGLESMKSLPFKPGDILVCDNGPESIVNGTIYNQSGVFHLDMSGMFERPHAWGDNVFFDQRHPNECGQFAIAF